MLPWRRERAQRKKERERESLPRNIWRSICEESKKKKKRTKVVCTLRSSLDLSEISITESCMTSLTAGAVSSKLHVFPPNTHFPIFLSFFLSPVPSLFYSFIRESWLFDAGLWFSFNPSLSPSLFLSLSLSLLVLSCSLQAMRSSPLCSAGAAGALGYLENINDSKQPEELPGEPDALQSMGRNQYICVCIKIHKTVLTSHLLPGHRAERPAVWSHGL